MHDRELFFNVHFWSLNVGDTFYKHDIKFIKITTIYMNGKVCNAVSLTDGYYKGNLFYFKEDEEIVLDV